MKIFKKNVHVRCKHYYTLITTALLAGSFFQLVAPVLAEGTAAGTSISNTATGTYEDPNNPGTTINATSNTVTVTVAKVAGITVSDSGISDKTNPGGQVKVGDDLYYNYTVTNVGNNPGKFRIPNLASVTGPGTVSGNLQFSYDGGAIWTDITGSELITKELPAGGSVLVRVPVTVASGAQAGDTISVKLGQTPGDAQNQLRIPDGGDVYTVDSNDGTLPNEASGPSVNGVREASITEKMNVGNSAKTEALATILKTRTGFDTSGSTDKLNNDVLTYSLSLRVESNDVTNTGLTPAPLAGTTLTVDGSAVTRILISDAIPLNTVLQGTPTAPPGWIAVYTSDDPTTISADKAQWKTDPTKVTGAVRRVGFINDPTIITSVAPGQTVTGFTIQIKTQGLTGSATIANLAQVFGKTSGDPKSPLIYDDSGDQNPNNVDPKTGNPTSPNPDNGYIPDPTKLTPSNEDTGNNNTGSTPGGDANVFTISSPQANAVLNGPNGAPDAVGPTNTDDDFTNKSALIPPGTTPGSMVSPASVAFTNTVENNGTSTNNISLLLTAPATPGELPKNSVVTITYGSSSATYTYDGAVFNFTSGNGTVGGQLVSLTNPIRIDNLATGGKANYGVEVKLPDKTPLSTDTGKGFPVPITAFIDSNNNGVIDSSELTTVNKTIDRVYTGYVRLLKQSRVLQGTGPAIQTGQDTFSTTLKNPAPGNILEYRITYTNISEPQAGTGNVILNANNLVITEDGTLSRNNWALDNDKNGILDTSNIVGSAKDSGLATITFFSGNPATTSTSDQTGVTVTTDVTKYIDSVTGQVVPGQSRTFSFQRQVN
jgi:hypothetical protein